MSTILKSKFARPLLIQDALRDQGIAFFTPNEVSRFFRLSPETTKYFLETYTKRGLFMRVKKGLYALKSNMPREEVIANALYRPSYISLEYALSHYGIIPESPYSITSVTTKVSASFIVREKEFLYKKIKREAFTGYAPEKAGGHTIFMAEPEKALVDYLYFVSLGKKTLNDRLDISRLNMKKAHGYASLFDRPGLTKIVDALKLPS